MTVPTDLAYSGNFTIRTYEIDSQKRATAPALVKLMHEGAMQNVIRLKLSVWDLEPHQISWVLMRKYLHIERLPMLGETIQVVTYPAGFEKFFTYRDYKVFDMDDKLIAYSSSTWLVMDTKTRRMTRIPDFILENFQPRMPPVEYCLPRATEKPQEVQRADFEDTFTVHYFDLDFNQHLNNVFYVQWMLQTLPDNVLLNSQLVHLSIQYRAESHWKTEVLAQTQQVSDTHFLHTLKLKSSGKELAVAETKWKVG